MKPKSTFYVRHGKRLFDLALALFALLLFAPVLLLLAFLVRVNLGSPVLFRQPRPGKNGRTFTLCKFRTMTDARDAAGDLLSDEARLTRFGRFLRSTSLDELPELFNILCGHMSLVGPRPLLIRYLPYYTAREQARHAMRPGLTGWAQVNGRNNLPWDERLELDAWYVENCSLWLDLKIMVLTFWKVARREDVTCELDTKIGALDDERGNRLAQV